MFEFIFQKNCPILKAFGLVLIENEQLISVKKESRKGRLNILRGCQLRDLDPVKRIMG